MAKLNRRRGSLLPFKYLAGASLASATFARASSATFLDAAGVLQTAASGVPRDAHYIGGVRTLLLEGQRTNSFLNSGAPATHTSPSLGTGTYTLWLVGTGSIAVAAGTATITGAGTATSAAPVTFTVTVAGTVTFTVTGSPTRAQCENGAFPSSYIATAGSAVTRSADSLALPFFVGPQELTRYVRGYNLGSAQGAAGTGTLIQIGGSNPRWLINWRAPGFGSFYFNAAGTNGGVATAPSTPALNQVFEFMDTLPLTGAVTAFDALSDGAVNTGGSSATHAIDTAFATQQLGIGTAPGGSADGFFAFTAVKVALGIRTLAQMRAF